MKATTEAGRATRVADIFYELYTFGDRFLAKTSYICKMNDLAQDEILACNNPKRRMNSDLRIYASKLLTECCSHELFGVTRSLSE